MVKNPAKKQVSGCLQPLEDHTMIGGKCRLLMNRAANYQFIAKPSRFGLGLPEDTVAYRKDILKINSYVANKHTRSIFYWILE